MSKGAKRRVLQGARETFDDVSVIISEVSVAPCTEVGFSRPACLSLLESSGFAAINVADISSLGRGDPIAYMDVVFARSDSPMRLGHGDDLRLTGMDTQRRSVGLRLASL
jgi:hypothetical protein